MKNKRMRMSRFLKEATAACLKVPPGVVTLHSHV